MTNSRVHYELHVDGRCIRQSDFVEHIISTRQHLMRAVDRRDAKIIRVTEYRDNVTEEYPL